MLSTVLVSFQSRAVIRAGVEKGVGGVLTTYSERTIKPSANKDTKITVPLLAGNLPLIIHCWAWKYLW